ncbi:MAG: hypothetical protein CSA07_05095 [Bacteroidia bacterium]|nr:MAG: hypothetical protein CSA07_05095 [Bacteroidia bacterium]
MTAYLAALPLLLLTLLPLTTTAKRTENDPLSLGVRALRNNELGAAENFLSTAYRQNRKDTVCIYAYIETCIRLRKVRKAESLIKDAMDEYPKSVELQLKLGIVQNLKGDYTAAQNTFQKVEGMLSKGSSDWVTLYINHGLAILYTGDAEASLPWFDKALDLSPRNATAYNYKGSAFYMMKDYVSAVDAYDASIDIDNRNVMSFYNRGMAYLKSKRQHEACKDFHMACKMGNTNACKTVMLECKK